MTLLYEDNILEQDEKQKLINLSISQSMNHRMSSFSHFIIWWLTLWIVLWLSDLGCKETLSIMNQNESIKGTGHTNIYDMNIWAHGWVNWDTTRVTSPVELSVRIATASWWWLPGKEQADLDDQQERMWVGGRTMSF